METCTYDLDHSAIAASHYYRAYEGDRVNLCFGCASRFGYPQYLVEYPGPWRTQYGYLVNAHTGNGSSDWVSDLWPFEGEHTVQWLGILGCPDSELLVADACWEPYRPHYSENTGLVYEVTRVTCLPLV
ncbi:hypothetical protein SEA_BARTHOLOMEWSD_88 [Streptomyces phage BartholomewSD]|uniref:Uncharacterized protein n=1 Tax=Streptomyces phage Alvy TaxID=2599888 RepID=A0A5J6TP49_9CAUD|nr:hypothetical protein KGG89_gp04 [Streptomyces phage Alvy]QAX95536.1 hypothetical protein SEA_BARTHOLOMEWSD_88 [Streptomyces phage BartholomewSD]QFG12496.1 hypothetical protein SEA_ALVY_90 [Streptomyces phage Alvy]